MHTQAILRVQPAPLIAGVRALEPILVYKQPIVLTDGQPGAGCLFSGNITCCCGQSLNKQHPPALCITWWLMLAEGDSNGGSWRRVGGALRRSYLRQPCNQCSGACIRLQQRSPPHRCSDFSPNLGAFLGDLFSSCQNANTRTRTLACRYTVFSPAANLSPLAVQTDWGRAGDKQGS